MSIINTNYYLKFDVPRNVSYTLADNSWSTISRISQLGMASQFWNIGDTKSAGGYTATIIGFDYETNGGRTTTFSLGNVGTGTAATINFSPTSYGEIDSASWTNTHYYRTDSDTGFSTVRLYDVLNNLPLELQGGAIKTIDKEYVRVDSAGTRTLIGSFGLFVPSYSELVNVNTCYPYFRDANNLPSGVFWLRDAANYRLVDNQIYHYEDIAFYVYDSSQGRVRVTNQYRNNYGGYLSGTYQNNLLVFFAL